MNRSPRYHLHGTLSIQYSNITTITHRDITKDGGGGVRAPGAGFLGAPNRPFIYTKKLRKGR